MAMVTLGEAARLTGTAELARVYPPCQPLRWPLVRRLPRPRPLNATGETPGVTAARRLKLPDCGRSVNFCGGSSTMCATIGIGGAPKPSA
jgi:hypothetical protein